LATLTDRNGNVTTWEYDLLDRVSKKIYDDQVFLSFNGRDSETQFGLKLHEYMASFGKT